MDSVNNGGLATVPQQSLEDLHAILIDTSIPADMAIASAVLELERLLNIQPEPIELEPTPELIWASDVDRYKGLGR